MRAWIIKLTYPGGQRRHVPVIAPDWASAARRALEQADRVPAGLTCKPVNKETHPCVPTAA
jgi:hypothetical protein